jgi:serine/threonine-protein kinase
VAVLAGYLVAALMFFPAPIFAASHGVPNVRGQPLEEAIATLEQAGFVVNPSDDRVSHPSVPSGAVVSQDPPPEVIAPEGTEIELVLSGGPQRVPVPDVGGYDAALARNLIESAGLVVGGVEQTQAPTPENVAVNTRPPAGSTLLPGSRVTLVVSVGAPTIRVPELLGLHVDSARVLLEARGLTLGDNYYQANSSVMSGTIFFQNPAGGTLTAPGTPVSVRIAREDR